MKLKARLVLGLKVLAVGFIAGALLTIVQEIVSPTPLDLLWGKLTLNVGFVTAMVSVTCACWLWVARYRAVDRRQPMFLGLPPAE